MDLIAVPEERSGTAMIYIGLTSVDAYFVELKGRNVASTEPGDRPYGMRDFEVVDPSGNRLAFGEPSAGPEATGSGSALRRGGSV